MYEYRLSAASNARGRRCFQQANSSGYQSTGCMAKRRNDDEVPANQPAHQPPLSGTKGELPGE